jgi:hypothetical protein
MGGGDVGSSVVGKVCRTPVHFESHHTIGRENPAADEHWAEKVAKPSKSLCTSKEKSNGSGDPPRKCSGLPPTVKQALFLLEHCLNAG